METTLMYLVSYTVGAKTGKFLVKNHVQVPESLLKTMAEEKIDKELYRIYPEESEIKTRTKLKRQSTIKIEDLNEVHVYTLDINFEENGKIKNTAETI